VALNDCVQGIIVVLDLISREVLNDDREQDHGELFVNELLRLTVREEELEKFVPGLVRNKDLSEGANYVGNVLLKDGNWLLYESLEKQCLGLGLVLRCQVHPQVANNLAQVDARHLSDVLVWAGRHQNQEILERAQSLEIVFQEGSCLLDDVGVGLEELRQRCC